MRTIKCQHTHNIWDEHNVCTNYKRTIYSKLKVSELQDNEMMLVIYGSCEIHTVT